LRMGKADLGAVHAGPAPVRWGALCPVRPGTGPVAWVATGSMATTALAVAGHWPGSPVWTAPVLKPFPEADVAAVCGRQAGVVALEEAAVAGGLGSAVAEVAGAHAPTWVCRVGVRDRFSRYCGTYQYLMREHGLDADAVREQVNEFLRRVPGLQRVAA